MGEENSRKRSDTFFNQQRSSVTSNSSRKRAHFQQSSSQDSFSATLAATFASIPDFDTDFSLQKPHEAKSIKIEDCEISNNSLSPDLYTIEATSSAILSSMLESSSNLDKFHNQNTPKGYHLKIIKFKILSSKLIKTLINN